MKIARGSWSVAVLLGLITALGSAQATTVKILDDNFTSNDFFLNSFYNGQAGFSSSLISGAVTGAELAGVDLFVAVNPEDVFTASENAAMGAYLAGGGRILFIGELGIANFTSRNAAINGALGALGSSIALTTDNIDGGQTFASVGDGQVLAHPLTGGMTQDFIYGGVSTLIGVPGGHGLIDSEDLPGSLIAGFDPVAGRGIVVVSDSSWLGFVSNGSFSNAQFALNIALVDVPADIPEPSTLTLMAALFVVARRFGRICRAP